MKGIVFDLDGTLVDSIPGIAVGVAQACKSLGYEEIPEEAVRGMVGKGAWKLCERCLDYLGKPVEPAAVESLEKAFVRDYAGCWISGTRIYPGMSEFLKQCAEKGWKLAVLTNKPHEIAVEMVQQVFRDVVDFDLIQGASALFPRKPDPAGLLHIVESWGLPLDEMVYIGDSRTDAETASRAGITCLLVDWGYDDNPGEIAEQYNARLADSSRRLWELLPE